MTLDVYIRLKEEGLNLCFQIKRALIEPGEACTREMKIDIFLQGPISNEKLEAVSKLNSRYE